MKSFRELEVWKKSMDLTDQVYDLLFDFPKEERFVLSDQLRRAVISIPSNIAEGFGRETHKDFAHFLSVEAVAKSREGRAPSRPRPRQSAALPCGNGGFATASVARGSLYEVDTQIEIALRRGYVFDATAVVETMNEVAKMLSSLSRHLHSTQSPGLRTAHQALSTKR